MIISETLAKWSVGTLPKVMIFVICFIEAIVQKLNEIMGKSEANAYILMEKLEPPLVENCVVGIDYPPPLRRQMVSELGIYGILLR